ncbi:unnamed protein product [Rotaria sordida]|uniref:Uncharacterized protein n=1 Tax=Rotaria sordida TaxID=392033 RepID=A0A815QJZ9_9BILA|nr:unnamed protein product [Rotaria sordida]CAF1462965.1 unnamed protein product [Rotaria sordida]
MLDKIIDFLKPWTHVMKRIQSLQISSIHTVTPSLFIINSSLNISQHLSSLSIFKENKVFQVIIELWY